MEEKKKTVTINVFTISVFTLTGTLFLLPLAHKDLTYF